MCEAERSRWPVLQTFDYIPPAGAAYARGFALYERVPADQRLFYYDPDDDCTNFISQCVWAAYGGWLPGYAGDMTRKNAVRILQNVRQAGGVWYGSKSHMGSNAWCRVVEFYNYITSRKAAGPLAKQIAEGSFSRVDPGTIRAGDVIQMVVASYTPDRYGHSLYVTKGGPQWENITVCCHSFDRLDAPMTVFTQFPDQYRRLRVLRFESTRFEE